MSEVKCVGERLRMVKLQVDRRTVVVVSAYTPQQGLDNGEKDPFYESVIQLIESINEKDMVIIGGDLKGQVRKQGVNG